MPHSASGSDSTAPTSLRVDGSLPSPPRVAVFRTKIWVGFMVAAVVFVAIAVVAAVASRLEAERLERLRDRGIVTEARIERKWKSGGKTKTRYLSYSFTHERERYTDQDSVSSDLWNASEPGLPIRITFDPADPTETEVGNVTQQKVDDHWRRVFLGGGAIGLVFLALLAFVYLQQRRRKVLLAEGDLMSARIESIGPPSRKGKSCMVVFAVSLGAGATESHRHSVAKKLLDGLAAGASVPYLVMRHDRKRGAPLAICQQSCRVE